MRTFHCDHCGNALHFENVSCLQCGSSLAFLPDRMDLCAVEPVPGEEGVWQRRERERNARANGRWRLCANHGPMQACNFAVPAHDPNALCVSCRQTRMLPDLSVPQNKQRWYRIEVAKRRLFFTLARLGLVPTDPARSPGHDVGPVYEFLADQPGQPVMTGHASGVITLNVAEADDDERVRRRIAMGEPYRTLLGHLRHESGHYYWERLVRRAGRQEAFRRVFGDERIDYAQALRQHYDSGGEPANWQQAYVSAYAAAHPWEDWAETWAHYLHMVDLLETAADYRTRVRVPGAAGGEAQMQDPYSHEAGHFDELVAQWVPLTLLLNSLNRSLGHQDAYPFALSPTAQDKLRFVHDTIYGRTGSP